MVLIKGQHELVIYYLEEVIPQLKKLEKENIIAKLPKNELTKADK